MHVKELLSLRNKVILVTGGAGNYGRCIVEGLAEADGTVVIASRNLQTCQNFAEKLKSQGLDVHALQLDQANHQSVLDIKQQLQDKFGGLDVFVNNAVARPTKGYSTQFYKFDYDVF